MKTFLIIYGVLFIVMLMTSTTMVSIDMGIVDAKWAKAHGYSLKEYMRFKDKKNQENLNFAFYPFTKKHGFCKKKYQDTFGK